MTGAPAEVSGSVQDRRPLFVYNGGFLTQTRVRRILTLAGYDIRLGKPGPRDMVGVWGKSPTAPRGEKVADLTGAALLHVEDAFLRSVRPGRDGGGPPLGLMLDRRGVHFDPAVPSELEHILATDPLDDASILLQARDGIERLKAADLSKYNHFDPDLPVPDPGYVLVVDQTRGDASVTAAGFGEGIFREMLVFAQTEHPQARIVIKTHPETGLGHRPGYYGEGHAHGRISVLADPVSPWKLLEGAIAVYTVSSQLGFEAILAGHRPRVFGQPFYAGWGLSDDENPVARRHRKLTRTQLFAAAMILAPTWYDPARDRLCSFEEAVNQLEATVRAFRQDRTGHVACGMRLWKRAHLQGFFGTEKPVIFRNDPGKASAIARREGRRLIVWAGAETEVLRVAAGNIPVARIEDGFLRSRGLGAQLVPPLSLVLDDLGICCDPSRESRLERLIATPCPPWAETRAMRLIERIASGNLSKYNPAAGTLPALPPGRRILVPGQVEDDAAMRFGAGVERTNLSLLTRVRSENPDAVVLYKPHPDVEAGLRIGALPDRQVLGLADRVIRDTGPAQIIDAVDEVWTISSTLGFEALMRGKPVMTLGMPFYAGWGLTRDLFQQPARRKARPSLAALVHAALVAYPRYVDPVSGMICPPEVIVERLRQNAIPKLSRWNRSLSKLQGAMASQSWLWR